MQCERGSRWSPFALFLVRSLAFNQLCGVYKDEDGYLQGTYNLGEGISKIAEMLAVNTTLQSIEYVRLHCARF